MSRTDTFFKKALKQRVFPGAVALVAQDGNIVFHRAWGFADLFSRQPMTKDTVFDLASLTKPLATTPAVLRLVDQGRLSLDGFLGHYLPAAAGTPQYHITIRQLLTHRAGLTAWRPFYNKVTGKSAVERRYRIRCLALSEPLATAPGCETCYSDIGFILLEWVVERMTGVSLSRWVSENIYRPWGIELFFPPVVGLQGQPVAATEWCLRRGGLIKGTVHDDNARAMGGGAGHAGLFGTAAAVYRLLTALFGDSFDNTGRFGNPSLTAQMLAPVQNGWRPLGMDIPAVSGASCGRFFSVRSVGHLGFTGTSFWIDPEKAAVVVLLTNRVHPSRYSSQMKAFRPVAHDFLLKAPGMA